MSGSLYLPQIQSASSTYGVPQSILYNSLGAESSFNPDAYNSSSGTEGMAQFLPSTAAELGVDPWDPDSSINGAAAYLGQLYDQLGSWTAAVTAYGTVPSTGAVTSGQQAVLAAAQQADAAGATNLTDGYISADGSYVPPDAIPASGATPGTLSTTKNQAGGDINVGLSPLLTWLEAGALRVGIGVIVVIFLVIGVGALAFNKGPAQSVKAVVGTIP